MGIVVSHKFDGMLRRDLMLFHEVADLRVFFIDSSGFSILPPGGAFSLSQGFSSPPRVVTRSIAKVVLGSAKTRRAILTKRPTSFWA